jgi:hypothetical protein
MENDKILGSHIDQKGEYPMRIPTICPVISKVQKKNEIITPKMNPTV